MPEIRTDRIVSKPGTATCRVLTTPVTTEERTTVIRERASNKSAEVKRGATRAATRVGLTGKLLWIDCSAT